MLDDDDRVSLIAKPFERFEQHPVVARMQSDRRLIEDVQHAHQSAADLPGQPNPLRLPARKRRSGAIQREVAEAALQQKPEPPANLLERILGDESLRVVEFEVGEELSRVVDGESTELRKRKS